MEERNQRAVIVVALVVLVVAVASSYDQQQKNNQIVRPNPDGPPAPVVPQLPKLVADLASSKALYEGQVSVAKKILIDRQFPRSIETEGQELFASLKAEHDGCIAYLRAGLARRFNGGDPAQIQARLQATRGRADRFQHWYDRIKHPSFGALDPLTATVEMICRWMDEMAKQNNEAIEQLRSDLETCRLRNWAEL